MKYYEVTSCRLAIRLCVGYGANGRKKHRTFSMRNINPNASWEGIMAVIRALAPVLEFPIVDVQKITSRKIIFYEDAAPSAPAIILPIAMTVEPEIVHAELVDPIDSLDLEIAIWEEMRAREEQKEFAHAGSGMGKWSEWSCSPNFSIRAPPVSLHF